MPRFAVLIVSVLAVVPLGVFAVTTGAHQGTPAPADDVVATWRATVSPPQGAPHPGLVTFVADGTLLVADVPSQPAPPGVPATTLFFSGGHGVWEATEQGAAFTFDLLTTTEAGMPFGTLTLRGMATLGPDGQSLAAAYTLDFTNPTGQVVSAGQGSFEDTRMRVEPMGTPVAGTPAT